MLSIKDTETERLAHELAQATRESITDAIAVALQERLDRVRAAADSVRLTADLLEIGHHCAQHATLDPRSPDEILSYNESGLPG
ncbi:MAG TPA: type II toxin-antitoxin system VapB family antitoxin [Candidatus Baltobacteraceae bacterium]|jgi:antitoxin VapB|nr:type II toxin-antitoxin system VapB family antitoxin [Candidatus Baltobacteraceae bacterium]